MSDSEAGDITKDKTVAEEDLAKVAHNNDITLCRKNNHNLCIGGHNFR